MLWETLPPLQKMHLAMVYLKRGCSRLPTFFNQITSTALTLAELYPKHPTRRTPSALGTLCQQFPVLPFLAMKAL